jgi:DNA-binding beta-propeller fold protein YncE
MRGLAFKPDGMAFYVVTFAAIRHYSLSTAWDITTADYVSNLDLSAGSPIIGDLYIKADGTKLYAPRNMTSNDDVRQYTLSPEWNTNTAVYDSLSKVIASEDNAPTGIAFSDDGTSMYIAGDQRDDIFQYALSTAWDVSSAVYASKSFDVNAATGGTPRAIFMGSRMAGQGSSPVAIVAGEVEASGKQFWRGCFRESEVFLSESLLHQGIHWVWGGTRFHMVNL